MALIRIGDIPAPPSVAGAAPIATEYPIPNVGKTPYIQTNFPNIPVPPSYTGSNARVKAPSGVNPGVLQPMDIEGKTAQLMQSTISAEPWIAAGRAGIRQGEAIVDIGSQISSAGDTVAQLGQWMQRSKNEADISRGHNLIRVGLAAFEEEAAKVPFSQHQQLWAEKYKPGIEQGLSAIGMGPYAADRVFPDWQVASLKQQASINQAQRDQVIKSDKAQMLEEMDAAIANGDWGAFASTNVRFTLGGHQTVGEQNARQRQANDAYREWEVSKDINSNPRMVQAEMDEAKVTGKSDIYPHVTNPVTISKLHEQARVEGNRREQDAYNGVANDIVAGKIKKREDIVAKAEGNIGAVGLANLEQMLYADPEHSTENVMKARSLAENYDPVKDPDLKQWDVIQGLIATTVPKDVRPVLTKILEDRNKGTKGDKDPPQWYAPDLLKRYEELTDRGYFDEGIQQRNVFGVPRVTLFGGKPIVDKLDREKLSKDPLYALEHRAEDEAAWVRSHAAQTSMRQWLLDNPKASETEAMAEMNTQLEKQSGKSAKDAWKPKIPEKAAGPTSRATPYPVVAPATSASTKNYGPNLNPALTGILGSIEASGPKLSVISGYRSPEHNASVGGAKGSQHIHGNAVDIDTSAMSHEERLDLIRLASANGITGIGVYKNNLHFDVGRRRAWGSDYTSATVPEWAKGAISEHLAATKKEKATPYVVPEVTAYRPGLGGQEGGPLDQHGNQILGKTTMEDYAARRGDYVTVAMDKQSDWQGKFLRSPAYPGIVFKVSDTGSYGKGKGKDWIDIAWTDPAKARNYKKANTLFEVIPPGEAFRISGTRT